MIAGNLRTLMRHGVRIALGSDRFRATSTSEARALLRLGVVAPLTALKMWCETTPAAIFPERRIGRLSDGYEASFLVLEGNPLEDFANTGRILMRVKRGRVLPEPQAP
jgi:imidazolonepropionase-like amidohydrolase